MAAFLFHRSLRLDDNLGLLKAIAEEKIVYPIFCVDPRQATPEKNPYFSPFCLGFMLQSLQDLQQQLQEKGSDLLLLLGEPHKQLPDLFKQKQLQTLYMNYDYSPFARQRKHDIQEALQDVKVIEVEDYLLYSPGSILTKAGTAYRVYTSFLNESKKKVSKISKFTKFPKTKHNLASKKSMKSLVKQDPWKLLEKYSKYSIFYIPGGRKEGLRRLQSLPETQKYYDQCRDYLTYQTSHLSAYIKFGCISIREAWEGFGNVPGKAGKNLRRELLWREFFYHYYIAYPEELEWDKKAKEATLVQKAPDIVKACFKELDTIGYLHNRGRMIVANYILKNQKEYWKSGDRMYAKRLVDYDPFVNIGNWKWIDKQPSFRTLKPSRQYEQWDRGCPKVKEKIPKGSYTRYWLQSKQQLQQQLQEQ